MRASPLVAASTCCWSSAGKGAAAAWELDEESRELRWPQQQQEGVLQQEDRWKQQQQQEPEAQQQQSGRRGVPRQRLPAVPQARAPRSSACRRRSRAPASAFFFCSSSSKRWWGACVDNSKSPRLSVQPPSRCSKGPCEISSSCCASIGSRRDVCSARSSSDSTAAVKTALIAAVLGAGVSALLLLLLLPPCENLPTVALASSSAAATGSTAVVCLSSSLQQQWAAAPPAVSTTCLPAAAPPAARAGRPAAASAAATSSLPSVLWALAGTLPPSPSSSFPPATSAAAASAAGGGGAHAFFTAAAAGVAATKPRPDSTHGVLLQRLAFGSCYRTAEQKQRRLSLPKRMQQLLQQWLQGGEETLWRGLQGEQQRLLLRWRQEEALLWQHVRATHPTVWLWLGDAGYAPSGEVQAVQESLQQVAAVPQYRDMAAETLLLDGTRDDNDFGMNDGGRNQPHLPELQQAFLDFLQVPANSPRRSPWRAGVYSSHVFGVYVHPKKPNKVSPPTTSSSSDNSGSNENTKRSDGSSAEEANSGGVIRSSSSANPGSSSSELNSAGRSSRENRNGSETKRRTEDSSSRSEDRHVASGEADKGNSSGAATPASAKEIEEEEFIRGTEVKILLLDTRTERSLHYIPSPGMLGASGLLSMLAAGVRTLCHIFGIGYNYDGDILGEEQWQWLEQQLTNSTAAVHLLVSSIQISTSLPSVESWGHLPAARRRLAALLQRTRPAGLMLLSGDVHFAEILGSPKSNIYEITTSGLTHTAGESWLQRFFLENVFLRFFDASPRADPAHPAVYVHRNFGLLEFDYFLENGQTLSLSHSQGFSRPPPDMKISAVEIRAKILDGATGEVALQLSQRFPVRHPSRRLQHQQQQSGEGVQEEEQQQKEDGEQQDFEAWAAELPDVIPQISWSACALRMLVVFWTSALLLLLFAYPVLLWRWRRRAAPATASTATAKTRSSAVAPTPAASSTAAAAAPSGAAALVEKLGHQQLLK